MLIIVPTLQYLAIYLYPQTMLALLVRKKGHPTMNDMIFDSLDNACTIVLLNRVPHLLTPVDGSSFTEALRNSILLGASAASSSHFQMHDHGRLDHFQMQSHRAIGSAWLASTVPCHPSAACIRLCQRHHLHLPIVTIAEDLLDAEYGALPQAECSHASCMMPKTRYRRVRRYLI